VSSQGESGSAPCPVWSGNIILEMGASVGPEGPRRGERRRAFDCESVREVTLDLGRGFRPTPILHNAPRPDTSGAQDRLVFLMTPGTDSVVPPNGQKLLVTSKTSPFYDIEGFAVGPFVVGAAVTGFVRPPQLFSANGTVHVRSSVRVLEPIDSGPHDPETWTEPGPLPTREGEFSLHESILVGK